MTTANCGTGTVVDPRGKSGRCLVYSKAEHMLSIGSTSDHGITTTAEHITFFLGSTTDGQLPQQGT